MGREAGGHLMARVRVPAATEAEVKQALTMANTYSARLRSATTIAGLVANARGCKDSWPNPDSIRQYVSMTSVKAMLKVLIERGECWAVPGNHWSLGRGVSPKYTYYFNEEGKKKAEEDKWRVESSRRRTRADDFAVQELVRQYGKLYNDLREQWFRDNPETDWSTKW